MTGVQTCALPIFLQMKDAADTIGKIYDDTLKPVTDDIAKLTTDIDTTSITDLMATLSNSTDITEQSKLVKRIHDKIMVNYNTELSSVKSLTTSLFNLKKVVDSLKLSALTILDPKQKLEEAKQQYALLLDKVNNGTAEEAAAATADLGKIGRAHV